MPTNGGPIQPANRSSAAGCAVVVALILAGAALFSTFLPLRFPWAGSGGRDGAAGAVARGAAVSQQKDLVDKQLRILRKEALLVHDERIAARKQRLLLLAERHRKGTQREYDRIALRNACRFEVAVALHYRDLDDTWVTRGWWMLPPGGSVTTDAMTRNRPVYFYAENQAVGRTWDGKADKDSLALQITDSRFDQVEDEDFLYDKARKVPFFRRDTGAAWTDYTEPFECPAEAPPPKGPTPAPGSVGQTERKR